MSLMSRKWKERWFDENKKLLDEYKEIADSWAK